MTALVLSAVIALFPISEVAFGTWVGIVALLEALGPAHAASCARTKRFIPGVL